MPKIIVQKETEMPKTYNLPEKEEIIIGCSSGCDIPIEDPSVAAEQAKILLREDGFYLQLLSHIPPVFVTEERVEKDVKLEDGDTIRIEEFNLILNVLPGEVKVKEEEPEPVKQPEPEEKEPTEPDVKSDEEEKPPVETESKKDVVQEAIDSALDRKEKELSKPEVKKEEKFPDLPEKTKEEIPAEEPQDEKPVVEKPPEIIKTEEVKVADKTEEPKPEVIEKPVEPKPEKTQEPPKPEPKPEPPPVEKVPEQKVEVPKSEEEKPKPEPEDMDRKTKVLSAQDIPASPSKPSREEFKEKDLYLLAIGGPMVGEKFLIKKDITKLGRDRKKNDIVIRHDSSGELDKSISREHARIEYSNEKYYLSDKLSQMRTKLNNRKIEKDELLPLSSGDIVEICSIKDSHIFRVAEEGHFDFSPPSKSGKKLVASNTALLPYIIGGVGLIIIIIVLILILK